MSTLAIPMAGQPIDVSMLSNIIETVNALADALSVSKTTTNQIWQAGGTARKNVPASGVMFVTDQILVPDFSGDVKSGTEKSVTFSYGGSFAGGQPVITVTPVSKIPLEISITSADSTKATVKVRMTKGGDPGTVYVNCMAIGIPG